MRDDTGFVPSALALGGVILAAICCESICDSPVAVFMAIGALIMAFAAGAAAKKEEENDWNS